jgi:purine-cytosine permease-like protein
MAIIFAAIGVMVVPHAVIPRTPHFSLAEGAAFVSFGGAVYGFATGWSSYAADYNVNQPEDAPAPRIFRMTLLGVVLPCILLEALGAALSTSFAGSTASALLASAVHPLGALAPVFLALLALSIVANNIPNDYSLGLSMQVVGRGFTKVNRAVWTVVGAVIYVAVAIPAAGHFNETLESFLLIVAYWLGPWAAILIVEHFVFRKGVYNAEDWNTRERLPIGWAALVAMGAGLVGVSLTAAQSLFVGPIARRLNPPYGIDLGFEAGMVVAALVYLAVRPIERRTETAGNESV